MVDNRTFEQHFTRVVTILSEDLHPRLGRYRSNARYTKFRFPDEIVRHEGVFVAHFDVKEFLLALHASEIHAKDFIPRGTGASIVVCFCARFVVGITVGPHHHIRILGTEDLRVVEISARLDIHYEGLLRHVRCKSKSAGKFGGIYSLGGWFEDSRS